MALNDKEKEIWEKLETELLAEESIRKADQEMVKAASGDGRKLIAGGLLIVAGLAGLIISVINKSVIAGLAAFGIMFYGTLLASTYIGKMKFDFVPKNTGFSEAYNNMKNYKPGDRWY